MNNNWKQERAERMIQQVLITEHGQLHTDSAKADREAKVLEPN
jgi:hypothetical protein